MTFKARSNPFQTSNGKTNVSVVVAVSVCIAFLLIVIFFVSLRHFFRKSSVSYPTNEPERLVNVCSRPTPTQQTYEAKIGYESTTDQAQYLLSWTAEAVYWNADSIVSRHPVPRIPPVIAVPEGYGLVMPGLPPSQWQPGSVSTQSHGGLHPVILGK